MQYFLHGHIIVDNGVEFAPRRGAGVVPCLNPGKIQAAVGQRPRVCAALQNVAEERGGV